MNTTDKKERKKERKKGSKTTDYMTQTDRQTDRQTGRQADCIVFSFPFYLSSFFSAFFFLLLARSLSGRVPELQALRVPQRQTDKQTGRQRNRNYINTEPGPNENIPQIDQVSAGKGRKRNQKQKDRKEERKTES